MVNIVDFSSKTLSAWDVRTKDFCIHYIKYDEHVFYLVLDSLKGFTEVDDGIKYLTMIFLSEDQKMMYDSVCGKELKESLIMVLIDDFSKDYGVIMFDSVDDVVGMINISSMTVIIRSALCKDNCFYPQIHLNYCSYDVKA